MCVTPEIDLNASLIASVLKWSQTAVQILHIVFNCSMFNEELLRGSREIFPVMQDLLTKFQRPSKLPTASNTSELWMNVINDTSAPNEINIIEQSSPCIQRNPNIMFGDLSSVTAAITYDSDSSDESSDDGIGNHSDTSTPIKPSNQNANGSEIGLQVKALAMNATDKASVLETITVTSVLGSVSSLLLLLVKKHCSYTHYFTTKEGMNSMLRMLWMASASPLGPVIAGLPAVIRDLVSVLLHTFGIEDICDLAPYFLLDSNLVSMLIVVSIQLNGKGVLCIETATLLKELISALVAMHRCGFATSYNSKERSLQTLSAQESNLFCSQINGAIGFIDLFQIDHVRTLLPLQMQFLCTSMSCKQFSSLFNANVCTPEVIWNASLRQECVKNALMKLNPWFVEEHVNVSMRLQDGEAREVLANEPQMLGVLLYMLVVSFPQEFWLPLDIEKLLVCLLLGFRSEQASAVSGHNPILHLPDPPVGLTMEEYACVKHSMGSVSWMSPASKRCLFALCIGRCIEMWTTRFESWQLDISPVLLQFLHINGETLQSQLMDRISSSVSLNHVLVPSTDIVEVAVGDLQEEDILLEQGLEMAGMDSRGLLLPSAQEAYYEVTSALVVFCKSIDATFSSVSLSSSSETVNASEHSSRLWRLFDSSLHSLCVIIDACTRFVNKHHDDSETETASLCQPIEHLFTTSMAALSIMLMHAIEGMSQPTTADKTVVVRSHKRWSDEGLLRILCACCTRKTANFSRKICIMAVTSLHLLVAHYNLISIFASDLGFSRGDNRDLNIDAVANSLFSQGLGSSLVDCLLAGPHGPNVCEVDFDVHARWSNHPRTSSTQFVRSNRANRTSQESSRQTNTAKPLKTSLSEILAGEERVVMNWLKDHKKSRNQGLVVEQGSFPLTGTPNCVDWDVVSRTSQSSAALSVSGSGSGIFLRNPSDLESVTSSIVAESPSKINATMKPLCASVTWSMLHVEICELLRLLLICNMQGIAKPTTQNKETANRVASAVDVVNVNNVGSNTYNKHFGAQMEILLTPSLVYVLVTDSPLFLHIISNATEVERPLAVWNQDMRSRLEQHLRAELSSLNMSNGNFEVVASDFSGAIASKQLYPNVSSECIVDSIYIRLLTQESHKDDLGCRNMAKFVENLQSSIAGSRTLIAHLQPLQQQSSGSTSTMNSRQTRRGSAVSSCDLLSLTTQLALKETVLRKLLSDHPELGYSSLEVAANEDSFVL